MRHAREFDTLIRDYGPMIGRICASYERDPEIARELVQDVLFAVWRALPTHRGSSTLKTFAARIAQFRAISHVAKQSRRLELEPVTEDLRDPAALPETAAIALDQRNRLMAAVRSLPINYREPAVLTLEGLTVAEIASVIGISADLVAVRMSRARAMLRRLLGEHDEG
jgi:RNA polymerase sigma-70 factor (ECF subfamily)